MGKEEAKREELIKDIRECHKTIISKTKEINCPGHEILKQNIQLFIDEATLYLCLTNGLLPNQLQSDLENQFKPVNRIIEIHGQVQEERAAEEIRKVMNICRENLHKYTHSAENFVSAFHRSGALEVFSDFEVYKKRMENILCNLGETAEHLFKRLKDAEIALDAHAVEKMYRMFSDSYTEYRYSVWQWGVATCVTFLFLLGSLGYFYFDVPNGSIENMVSSQIYYQGAIRFFALAAMGYMFTFFARNWRSSLHIKVLTRHKMNLAGHLQEFLGACEQEERKEVIANLMNSISTPGVTGYLHVGKDQGFSPLESLLQHLMKNR